MSNRLERYNANLPRNLTYRKGRQSYYWRNPVTGQEISLGRISRREAISQAIEANNYIEQNYIPFALLDRIKEAPEFTFEKWLERYRIILARRSLKPGTMKVRTNQLATLQTEFGRYPVAAITTRQVATFLDTYVENGKQSMAAALRSLMLDVFREAIVESIISHNPVEPTRTPAPKVKRERLSLEQFTAIRQAASEMGGWLVNTMNIALLTGPRREDITLMKFSDVHDDRLFITQSKTEHKLALPLTLTLNATGITFQQVVDACRDGNPSDHLIYSAVRRGGRRAGPVLPDALTSAFAEA